ncbi:MAG: PAS domain S-box protein, partial [Bacteroidota bacterium]
MSPKPINLPELSLRALNDLPEAVFWFDRHARLIEVNEVACKGWGYSREELLQMTIFDVNPNMRPETWDAHWKAKRADSSTFESSHRKKDGTIFPVDITDNFVELNGEVYSCAIIRDISERKNADRLARLSNFTIQRAGDAIFWIDPEGFIKHANQEAQNRYGYTAEEFNEMSILQLSKNMSSEAFKAIWGRLQREKKLVVEGEHFTKMGKKIEVEISTNHIQFEDMEYTCSFVRDISERKRKEAALRGALMEIRELKEKLEAENNYLQEEIE